MQDFIEPSRVLLTEENTVCFVHKAAIEEDVEQERGTGKSTPQGVKIAPQPSFQGVRHLLAVMIQPMPEGKDIGCLSVQSEPSAVCDILLHQTVPDVRGKLLIALGIFSLSEHPGGFPGQFHGLEVVDALNEAFLCSAKHGFSGKPVQCKPVAERKFIKQHMGKSQIPVLLNADFGIIPHQRIAFTKERFVTVMHIDRPWNHDACVSPDGSADAGCSPE